MQQTCGLKCGGIGPDRVVVGGIHGKGAVRQDPVQRLPRGFDAIPQNGVVGLHRKDQLVIGVPLGPVAHHLGQLGLSFYTGEIQTGQFDRAAKQMDMAVDETRQHRRASSVDHAGGRPRQCADLCGGANSGDDPICDGQAFGVGARAVKGDQAPIEDHGIWGFGHNGVRLFRDGPRRIRARPDVSSDLARLLGQFGPDLGVDFQHLGRAACRQIACVLQTLGDDNFGCRGHHLIHKGL